MLEGEKKSWDLYKMKKKREKEREMVVVAEREKKGEVVGWRGGLRTIVNI